jgi:hypothetical protein
MCFLEVIMEEPKGRFRISNSRFLSEAEQSHFAGGPEFIKREVLKELVRAIAEEFLANTKDKIVQRIDIELTYQVEPEKTPW